MSHFDLEKSNSEFYRGKRFLDFGRLEQAIEIYTNLINQTLQCEENADVILTLETSYNNRGVAICRLALQQKNKDLYLTGVDDFEKSVAFTKDEQQKKWLTANGNLENFKKQLQSFDNNENQDESVFRSV